MSEPGLTSEQRAAIAVHNATHARQCLASINEQGWGKDGTLCQRCAEVADQIDAAVEVERQAAEERGRRAGIEEALRAVEGHWVTCSCPDRIAALAPRDSAPECGHLLSRDLGAEWRCGKPAGHEGPHSGEKP